MAGRKSGTVETQRSFCASYRVSHVLNCDMTVEEIEETVAKLPPDELAKFRAWFESFEADRFDRKIQSDASAGKLDRLADEALAEYRTGRAREL
jgi:hypothetical protein